MTDVNYNLNDSLSATQLKYCEKLRAADFFELDKDLQTLRLKIFSLELINDRIKKPLADRTGSHNKVLRMQLADSRKDIFNFIHNALNDK